MDQTKRTDGRTEPPASTLAFGKLVDSAKNLQESCKHRQDLQLWTWNSVELCLCVWDRRRKKKKNTNRKLILRVWEDGLLETLESLWPGSPTSPDLIFFSILLVIFCFCFFFSNYIFAQRCTLTHSPVHYFSWWDGRRRRERTQCCSRVTLFRFVFCILGVLLTNNCCFFSGDWRAGGRNTWLLGVETRK